MQPAAAPVIIVKLPHNGKEPVVPVPDYPPWERDTEGLSIAKNLALQYCFQRRGPTCPPINQTLQRLAPDHAPLYDLYGDVYLGGVDVETGENGPIPEKLLRELLRPGVPSPELVRVLQHDADLRAAYEHRN